MQIHCARADEDVRLEVFNGIRELKRRVVEHPAEIAAGIRLVDLQLVARQVDVAPNCDVLGELEVDAGSEVVAALVELGGPRIVQIGDAMDRTRPNLETDSFIL